MELSYSLFSNKIPRFLIWQLKGLIFKFLGYESIPTLSGLNTVSCHLSQPLAIPSEFLLFSHIETDGKLKKLRKETNKRHSVKKGNKGKFIRTLMQFIFISGNFCFWFRNMMMIENKIYGVLIVCHIQCSLLHMDYLQWSTRACWERKLFYQI